MIRYTGLILLIILMTFISSCYEKKEGCLDIYATNFDAQADKSCCCQYPKLVINFNHFLGTNTFNANDTLVNDLGQSFKITSFSYYLSEFLLSDDNGNIYTTTDTFHIPVTNGEVILKNDIALVRPGTVTLTLGSFSQKTEVTNLKFQYGPPAEADDALIDQIPSTRSLSRQADTLYSSTPVKGYASIKIKYKTGIEADAVEKTIYIYDKIPLEFDNVSLPLKVASDVCISIFNDYKYWFHDVNVKLDDVGAAGTKIINNIKNSTLVVPCE